MITTHALTRALINLTERDGSYREAAANQATPRAPAETTTSTVEAQPDRSQCISPYLNPAHVLAPPRAWLEAVGDGSISWEFFRLRYKHLLRSRLKEDPEAFFTLLEDSAGGRDLKLTCHCLTGPCHVEVAREFLMRLRDQDAYLRWAEMRRQVTLFPLPLHHASHAAR